MRFRINFTDFNKTLEIVMRELAISTEDHYKDRIRRGMPPPLKKPRRDGSANTPLFHTGKHLWASIKTQFLPKGGFRVGSNWIGARTQHEGLRGVRARPFLRPDEALRKKWKDIWQSHSA
jgi:hypothetical protein